MDGISETPEEWRRTRLVLIMKKGDPTLPSNYRPIAVIPVLYKLYAKIILGRLWAKLEALQPLEQAGFRPHFSCSDHVHSLRLLAEKSLEWGQPVWVVSLDVEKALDRVLHSWVFKCLEGTDVDGELVLALQQIYTDLAAYVHIDVGTQSTDFHATHSVRQGDLLAPLLFISMLRVLFEEVDDVGKNGGMAALWELGAMKWID